MTGSQRGWRGWCRTFVLVPAIAILGCSCASGETAATVTIRGHQQHVRLYGTRGSGAPIVVSSGDGGWIHLAPHVAERLAAAGFFVVGFDVKAYLESFTSATRALRPEDEPADYALLATYAAEGSGRKPILIGVSEGAGLSVLAATDPITKTAIAGVVALGLPDRNELAWRWTDAAIYVTHGVPDEPQFSVDAIVARMAPLPLAAIHSSRDEFVPVADVQLTMRRAGSPSRLWIVQAANHRFSGNLQDFDARLLDAVAWVNRNEPR